MSKFDKENLVTLLKIFKNRPYHLAKYLVDNDAFNSKFLEKINSSQKLSELSKKSTNDSIFFTLSDMEDFYNSLIEESHNFQNKEQLEADCNKKLKSLIKLEKYEEAAILRDYMIKMGISKN